MLEDAITKVLEGSERQVLMAMAKRVLSMNVTGTILIDLVTVPEDRQRHRVGALADAPKGVTVEIVVGPLRVNPDTARLVRQFAEERDLTVVVKGTAYGVRNWITALRTGELCGVLL